MFDLTNLPQEVPEVAKETVDFTKWLELNSKLQKKKNALRKTLKGKGILPRAGENGYDHYSYFSEAQYKELFTELFSEHGLELNFTELEYTAFEGSEKQANGRLPKLRFFLFDIDTGFYETSDITGEGIDKGDKAGYKAYTGALKYYLANKFMVATGDDPERESPNHKMNKKREPKATENQVRLIKQICDVPALLSYYNIGSVEELTVGQASEIISKKKK